MACCIPGAASGKGYDPERGALVKLLANGAEPVPTVEAPEPPTIAFTTKPSRHGGRRDDDSRLRLAGGVLGGNRFQGDAHLRQLRTWRDGGG